MLTASRVAVIGQRLLRGAGVARGQLWAVTAATAATAATAVAATEVKVLMVAMTLTKGRPLTIIG